MGMTIEKINELVAQSKKKKEELTAEVDALLFQEAALDAEAHSAADSGNVELYLAKMEEKDKISKTLFVKRNFLDKQALAVTKEDCRAAWENYVPGYNKRLQKALADFADEKAKLCRLYSAAVDLQREALAVREHLAETVGDNKDSYTMEFIPVRNALSNGNLRLGGFNCCDPDANYYLSDYAMRNNVSLAPFGGVPNPEAERITSVVVMHKSR